MSSLTVSPGFEKVLISLGIPLGEVTPTVTLPLGASRGQLSLDAQKTLAPSRAGQLVSSGQLQQLSGIPENALPLALPASVTIFSIATLTLLAGQTLHIQGNGTDPVVLVVDTLRLEDGGLLECDASVITNVQLFTQDTSHE
ncbi:hypothetical protein IM880_10175 [Pectobacterium polaris]|uniref:Uncharacterized protein n=1 Tax=Pectobacterium polaris TaxID=2042057 RepID=A0AAW4NZK7_9GAMM|nr:hypothetical protein [Pectobacterium polaris]MBW5892576.1 hypothetical protein [Pectobacterium polaris]MCA6943437.1 hypothetical protein [Pectobacterium polaris]MCA6958814.1 hypothetical protein [Pectobacterium polaris]UAY91197.1 hypothetical protein KSL88_17085 [Pectobacterium polaris]